MAEAVTDMASDMIKFQAEREAKPGFSCPPDTPWMGEFEAAFPFVETKDQAWTARKTCGSPDPWTG